MSAISEHLFTDEEWLSYNLSLATYHQVKVNFDKFNIILGIVFGIAGIIGGILHLITLCHKEFSKPSYVYHKALVFNDLVYSGMGILCRALVTLCFTPSDLKSFLTDLVLTYSNFACLAAESVLLFMTFERVIAVWSPTRFTLVNRNFISLTACIFSFVLASAYLVDLGMETLTIFNTTDYKIVPTRLGISDFLVDFDYFAYIAELLVVYAMLLMSLIVVVGFCKKTTSNNAKETVRKRQLSVLALSSAIPAVLNCTIYVVRSACLGGYKIGPNVVGLSYSEATRQLTVALVNAVMYEFQLLTAILTHCFHFYVYTLLSSNFRDSAMRLLGINKNKSMIISVASATQFGSRRGSTML